MCQALFHTPETRWEKDKVLALLESMLSHGTQRAHQKTNKYILSLLTVVSALKNEQSAGWGVLPL